MADIVRGSVCTLVFINSFRMTKQKLIRNTKLWNLIPVIKSVNREDGVKKDYIQSAYL